MAYPRFVASAGIIAALSLVPSSTAFAQRRGTARAVPRGTVRVYRPPVVVGPRYVAPRYYGYRNYGYRPYVPGVNFSFFYGRPGYFGSYAYGSPFYAYGYPAYGYPAYGYPAYGYPAYGSGYAPYGYGYGGYSGHPYGGLRIDLPQRDAEVYVDGYFVGIVDNFDGVMQQANLEAGPHRIEIRSPEFQTIEFNVNIEPGRTITYRGSMRDLLP